MKGESVVEKQKVTVAQGASAVLGIVIVAVLALAAALISPSLVSGTGSEPAAGSGSAPAASASSATGQTTEVTVTVDGMRFVPGTIEVPAGNNLVVNFENTGDQRHDLVFANGVATEALAPGASARLDVGVITSNLDGWCSLPGHRQMGMVLEVVATGSESETTDQMGMGHEGMDHSATASAMPTMADLMDEATKHDPYPARVEPLPAADGPQTREYTFEVVESEEDLGAGIVRPLWTFNGTGPGPILHGRVGDEFVITLVNNGTMGHSIDFHAGEIAPDEVMRTIEPGESLEYRFTAGRSGIWMYHCGTMPMTLHIANGMFGAVIIEPDGLEPVDQSYVLIQSEYYQDEAGNTAADKLNTMIPDVAMFNGRAFQYDAHPLTAKVGDRVRFWVLDVGPNSPLAFHIVGTQFDTVWSEGHYSVHHGQSTDGLTKGVTGAQVLPLQAAQGGFVELVAPEPGHYAIVNHIMTLAEKGAHGILQVE